MKMEISDNDSTKSALVEGTIQDIDLLPRDLKMEQPRKEESDELVKIIEPLEFDYELLKKELSSGESRLRVLKDGQSLKGFSVITTFKNRKPNMIEMMWVDPEQRGMGIGKQLLQDSVSELHFGEISMSIWGGKNMIKLAESVGFKSNPGEGLRNRYTYFKEENK